MAPSSCEKRCLGLMARLIVVSMAIGLDIRVLSSLGPILRFVMACGSPCGPCWVQWVPQIVSIRAVWGPIAILTYL